MVRFILILIVILSASNGFSQILEFGNLSKLPPVVNSQAEESMPLLSPDQSKLFFVRSIYDGNTGGKYAGLDIWCSERTATGWKTPTNKFDFLNDKENNVLVGINSDGKTLYTMKSSPSSKLEGIYFTKVVGNQWIRPEFIPLPGIDNQDFVGIFVSPDFDVIFITMRGTDSRGEEDIYYSLKNASGNWSTPKNIGPTINTSGFEISPFLSTDKKRLYFSSNGHGGMGDADIFYSERLYNSWETWSAPVNLGDIVNSKKFDAYFSIYGDSIAYFTSNRESQFSDIYKVTASFRSSILAAGEKYLTDADWNSIIGKNINPKLTFTKRSKDLTSSQKELLYYIANKVSDKKNLNVHIVVQEEEDVELSLERLREIYGQLRQGGIESYRIKEDQQREAIKVSSVGVVEIRIYRTAAAK